MLKTALEVRHLHTWDSHTPVIQNLSFDAKQGELLALVSTCDSTRSSLINSLLGLVTHRQGSIRIHQTETIHFKPEQLAVLGVALCSTQLQLYPELSCEENLLMPLTTSHLGGGLSLIEIYELFPLLAQQSHQSCASLSPELQYFLAVARVLRSGADIIIFDQVPRRISFALWPHIKYVLEQLKLRGYTLVLHASNKRFATRIADKVYYLPSLSYTSSKP